MSHRLHATRVIARRRIQELLLSPGYYVAASLGLLLAYLLVSGFARAVEQAGLAERVDLRCGDAAQLPFETDFFDVVFMAFTLELFDTPEIPKVLSECKRVLKPAGSLMFTSFGVEAFRPMIDLFMARFNSYCPGANPAAAGKLNTPEQCRDLLTAAGYTDVEVVSEPLGYHLKGATDWWEVVYNSGLRGMLNQLPQDYRLAFQREHREEVERLVSDQGLWLNVETLFSFGRKPSA